MRLSVRAAVLLLLVALSLLALPTSAARSSAPTKPAQSAAAYVDPDFVPLSAEDEERLINGPAREEVVLPSTQPTSPVTSQVAERKPSKSPLLPIQTVDLSGDMALAALCRQLPLSPTAAPTSLALSYLSQLLRLLWVPSGLLDSGAGDHLLRVSMLEAQRVTLAQAFPSARAGGNVANAGAGELLREEDLLEVFQASRDVLQTLAVDLEAEARLDRAREGGDPLLNDYEQYGGVGSSNKKSWWNYPLQLLVNFGLQPANQEELDAFWCLLCISALAVASAGIGFTLGKRSGSDSLANSVNDSLHGDSKRAARRQRAQIFGWILLVVLSLTVLALCAGVYNAYGEERRRLIIIRTVAEKRGPPPGCRSDRDPSWLRDTWHGIVGHPSEKNDPCVKYLQSVEKSTRPDLLGVTLEYLAKNTVVLFGSSIGQSLSLFLEHQSFGTQFLVLTFLVALAGIAMLFGGPAAVCTLFCPCCCGRDRRARNDGGGAGAHRRLRGRDRNAAYSIESASDADSEVEEQRLLADLRRLRKQKQLRESDNNSSSSSRSRDLPRLTGSSGTRRNNAAEEEEDRDSRRRSKHSSKHRSRSRSRSHSRSRSRTPPRRRSEKDKSERRRAPDETDEDEKEDGGRVAAPAAASSSAKAAAATPVKSPPKAAKAVTPAAPSRAEVATSSADAEVPVI